MSDELILQSLQPSAEAARILDEFERRTGFEAEVRDDGRHYALSGDDHRTKVVRTLTEIDTGWTDHIGLKLPA